jgi:hypothetical protein
MTHPKAGNQGRKTHEQQKRILERKDDVAKPGDPPGPDGDGATVPDKTLNQREARQSELPVSRGGMHQESRDHNKHNNPGQSGHKPQKHSPAEEKH